jgi:hypothetical protein
VKKIFTIFICLIVLLAACRQASSSPSPTKAATPKKTAVPAETATDASAPPASSLMPLSDAADYVEGAQMFDGQQAFKHVEYLASDELEGRRSGTPGGQKASDYIAARFAEYGLQPAGADGTYFQSFTMSSTDTWDETPVFTVFFPSANASRYGQLSHDYVYQKEYLPFIRRNFGSGDVLGKVVWIGECAAENLREVLSSQIVLCRTQETMEYNELVAKALEYKVSGLLVIWDLEGPYARTGYRIGTLTGLPAYWITNSIAADLLAGTEYTLDELNQITDLTLLAVQVRMTVSITEREVEARNVLGLLPGTDPQFKDEVVIVSGHYDHMGMEPDGTIYNGANDNASGVAVVLEIARMWQAQGFQPKRSVLFVAWDAEEKGLLGSTHYVENPVYPLDHTAAVLNLDMAGMGDQLVVFGPEPIASQLGASAEALGFTAIIDPAATSGGSDEDSFLEAGITAGGYAIYPINEADLAYHLPEDDFQNVQPASLRTIGICSAHFLATWTGSGPAK